MKATFIDDAVGHNRAIKDFELVCRCDATITWFRIPNTSWTAAQARAQRDQARDWFNKYCIHLTFEQISFNMAKPRERRAKQNLDAAVRKYLQVVATIPQGVAAPAAVLERAQYWLLKIDDAIRRVVGRRRLVVIFLEEWYVLVGATNNPSHWRKNRISANDGRRLLIGLDRYDCTGRNVLTHELLHALRKPVRAGANARCRRNFQRLHNLNPNPRRTWPDHYGGRNQNRAMSRPNRAAAFRPLRMADSRVLTVTEYLQIEAAGYVTCGKGCTCIKKPRGRIRKPGGRRPKGKSKPRRAAKRGARRTKLRRR
jgi:hypothetical protein